jgi:hypothetical protein
MNTVVGLFDHYNNVDWAIEVLEDCGVDGDRISVVALDRDATEPGTASGLGVATGAATGGLVGLLAGLSAFIVPGVGPVIVTGALAGALFTSLGTTAGDAGLRAATGGLFGALMDLGFSEEEAAFYEEGVKRGRILVYVETGSVQRDRIKAILRGAGGVDGSTRSQAWKNEGRLVLGELEQLNEQSYPG